MNNTTAGYLPVQLKPNPPLQFKTLSRHKLEVEAWLQIQVLESVGDSKSSAPLNPIAGIGETEAIRTVNVCADSESIVVYSIVSTESSSSFGLRVGSVVE